MLECMKRRISRKLMFLQGILYWFGGFPAEARKIFADQPADLLQRRERSARSIWQVFFIGLDVKVGWDPKITIPPLESRFSCP